MNLEVTGILIMKGETQVVSEKFKKREFVLQLDEDVQGTTYTNFAKLQLTQAKVASLDAFTEGDAIKVQFNIRGSRWERDGKTSYITNLEAWRLEAAPQNYSQFADAQQQPQQQRPQPQQGGNQPQANQGQQGNNYYNPSPENADDLPF